jgi:hypothetical protein
MRLNYQTSHLAIYILTLCSARQTTTDLLGCADETFKAPRRKTVFTALPFAQLSLCNADECALDRMKDGNALCLKPIHRSNLSNIHPYITSFPWDPFALSADSVVDISN